jgi:hypothetical protein
MSLTVLNMAAAGKATKHKVTGTAPNMCITPAAPSPLPMPYPNLGNTSEGLDSGTSNTKFEGEPVLTTSGFVKSVHGNEAGTQKDVVSMTTGGAAYALVAPPTVMFEGAPVVITGSTGFSNAR